MAEGFYDAAAAGYNELYGKEQLRKIAVIKNVLKLKNNNLILDVGCGSGLSKELGCRIVGIDPAVKLLEQAKENITVVEGVAEELPFKDNYFDAVVCVTAIHNFNEPKNAIKEMKRVAKGKVVISLLKKSNKFDYLKDLVSSSLQLDKVVEEDKDVIFFCSKNKI